MNVLGLKQELNNGSSVKNFILSKNREIKVNKINKTNSYKD